MKTNYFTIIFKSSNKTAKEARCNEVPAIEIKSLGKHGIFFCSPSINKSGQPYEIVGTKTPVVLTEQQANEFELHIDIICRKYGIKYLRAENENEKSKSTIPICDLFKAETRIYEGHNRHEALLCVMESLLSRNKGILTLDQIMCLSKEWNEEHCVPPLNDSEFDRQWEDAIDFVERNNGKWEDGYGGSNNNRVSDDKNPPDVVRNGYNTAVPLELIPDVPNSNYSEFLINTVKKKVKQDEALIRQIAYTGLSAGTHDPLNLGIIAPISAHIYI